MPSLSLKNWYNQWGQVRFPNGIREHLKSCLSADRDQSLFLISDNGCQPTSQRFMMNCSLLGIKQIFTTWSNPKGNSDTERVMRTLKEDLVWTYDWDNPFAFAEELSLWINRYNSDYPHQTLNNMTPNQYFNQFYKEPFLTKKCLA